MTPVANSSADLKSIKTGPVVKRPSLQHKGKRKSAARLSFGPGISDGDAAHEDGDGNGEQVVLPRKSGLGRIAIERSAAERAVLDSQRPSYSKDALKDLQKSTPVTPQDSGSEDALNIVSKFGALAHLDSVTGHIPSEAEIREKKERRARLAKENEYISLHGDASSDEENRHRDLILNQEQPKYVETRLVREDEDLAEGFDDFVEDERITLSKKAKREAQKLKREEIASLIQDAQGDEEESDNSEMERNEAYDRAQTRAGTYGQQKKHEDKRPRTPLKITPIMDLSTVLGQLNEALSVMRTERDIKARRVEDIAAEKKQIIEHEAYIQAQLKETAEKYEKIRAEAGLAALSLDDMKQNGNIVVHRGLDNLGTNTPTVQASSEDDDYY